ncbi:MAG TPA: hypothetical protein VF417_06760, partial [Candidatus Methylomirabilis sp.]
TSTFGFTGASFQKYHAEHGAGIASKICDNLLRRADSVKSFLGFLTFRASVSERCREERVSGEAWHDERLRRATEGLS